jgi:hypothetical protein
MTDARRITRTCLVSIAVAMATAALLPASSAPAQGLFPLSAAAVAQNQSSSPAQSAPQSGAQPAAPPSSSQNQNGPGQTQQPQKKDDRMFYVMPNYLTVQNEAEVKPLNWKGKFAITADGAFDPYEFTIVGILAGIRQAENAYPGFGQGCVGYAKRYGAAMADQVDGNMMVGAVFPSILRTDPRYFQLGKGPVFRRFAYAISRIFVTRKDSGGNTVNFSEPVGNGFAIGISNFYYPAADRSFSSNLSGWGVQMGIDAFGNELKEFWPDIHRRITQRHHHDAATLADSR